MLGPVAITMLRERSIDDARFATSSRTVDPERFRQAFGAGVEQLDALVAQQTVTIAKLMEIAPPGTVDPTPSLYNLTMYLMAALLAIALVANALMQPVDAKHHMADAQRGARRGDGRDAMPRRASRASRRSRALLSAAARRRRRRVFAPPARDAAHARHAHRHSARLRDGRGRSADARTCRSISRRWRPAASTPASSSCTSARRRARDENYAQAQADALTKFDAIHRMAEQLYPRAHRDRVRRGRRPADRSARQARRRDRRRERLLARPESRDARPLLRARRALRRSRPRRRQRSRAFGAARTRARRRGATDRRPGVSALGAAGHRTPEPAWASWSTFARLEADGARRDAACPSAPVIASHSGIAGINAHRAQHGRRDAARAASRRRRRANRRVRRLFEAATRGEERPRCERCGRASASTGDARLELAAARATRDSTTHG